VPFGKTATLIGEVTPAPEHEPNCVQETNTLLPPSASAGLSWNPPFELAAIWW